MFIAAQRGVVDDPDVDAGHRDGAPYAAAHDRFPKDAVIELTRTIMMLQAEGSYAKAKDLVDRMGVVRPQVQTVLDRLTAVPVDIEPRFTTAEELR